VSKRGSLDLSSTDARHLISAVDRGRSSQCTEVGVPMLSSSTKPLRRRWLLVAPTAAAIFVLSLLGPIVPVASVAAASGWAAVSDHRTRRIPNGVIVVCALTVVIGALALWATRTATSSEIALALVVGVLLGGGPLLFAVWVVRPAAVGGGDWKLLLSQGAALGLVAPLAASLVLLVAGPTAAVQALCRRQTSIALGPALAVGFAFAAIAAFAFPGLLRGMR
jgi:Flp pilus assembly protein protease CpaA